MAWLGALGVPGLFGMPRLGGLKARRGRTEYRCPACGSAKIQGTAWVDLNTREVFFDSPPLDDYWCPECCEKGRGVDGHFSTVCQVRVADMFCVGCERPFAACLKAHVCC